MQFHANSETMEDSGCARPEWPESLGDPPTVSCSTMPEVVEQIQTLVNEEIEKRIREQFRHKMEAHNETLRRQSLELLNAVVQSQDIGVPEAEESRPSPAQNERSENHKALTVFEPEQFGFFNPPDVRAHIFDEDHIVESTDDGVLMMRDVTMFVSHVREHSHLYDEDNIKTGLSMCLQGMALEWWYVELTLEDRIRIRGLPLESGWCDALLQRFKPSVAEAMTALSRVSYTIQDARSRRSMVSFLYRVLSIARRADFSDLNALTWAYLHIDIEIRLNLASPTGSVSDYVTEVQDREQLVFELFSHHRDPAAYPPTQNGYGTGFTPPYTPTTQYWNNPGVGYYGCWQGNQYNGQCNGYYQR